MYRAVTWEALRRGVELEDESALVGLARDLSVQLVPTEGRDRLLVDGRDVTGNLRKPEVEHGVSLVAQMPGVRRALVRQQRAIAIEGSIVMAGRDIGTVVLPDAQVKVLLTASVEVRARRRHQELQRIGDPMDYPQVVDDLIRRDKIDSERTDSPLRPAKDAVTISTDDLGVADLAERILHLVGFN